MLQTQAQLAQDQYNLTSAINVERRNRIDLKQLLQLTDTAFDIAIPDTLINSGIVTPLATVRSAALANRPEMKNAEVSIDIAGKELIQTRLYGSDIADASACDGIDEVTSRSLYDNRGR